MALSAFPSASAGACRESACEGWTGQRENRSCGSRFPKDPAAAASKARVRGGPRSDPFRERPTEGPSAIGGAIPELEARSASGTRKKNSDAGREVLVDARRAAVAGVDNVAIDEARKIEANALQERRALEELEREASHDARGRARSFELDFVDGREKDLALDPPEVDDPLALVLQRRRVRRDRCDGTAVAGARVGARIQGRVGALGAAAVEATVLSRRCARRHEHEERYDAGADRNREAPPERARLRREHLLPDLRANLGCRDGRVVAL